MFDKLLNALKVIQLNSHLTNKEFAEKLGLHELSWIRIKKGRAPVSDKFLVRVNRVFPELGVFLSKDTNKEGKDVSQNSHQNALSQKLRFLWGKVRDSFKRKEK